MDIQTKRPADTAECLLKAQSLLSKISAHDIDCLTNSFLRNENDVSLFKRFYTWVVESKFLWGNISSFQTSTAINNERLLSVSLEVRFW